VTQTFDNNGNLTSDGVRAFKYDAFNRIIEVKIGTIILAEYQYDAFNRRVMKKVDADLNSSFETTVKFLYDGLRCIEELNASDSLVKEYVYGSLYIDEVILQKAGLNEYYFTHDYRYSVTSLTNSAGSIVESYDYKVYGQRTASGAGLTEVGYTGQRHDAETGLMYFKNRYYSTSMGSFVTRDPLGYVDGMSMYLGYFGGMGTDALGLEKVNLGDFQNSKKVSVINMKEIHHKVMIWGYAGRGTDADDETSGVRKLLMKFKNSDYAVVMNSQDADFGHITEGILKDSCRNIDNKVTVIVIGHSWGGYRAERFARWFVQQKKKIEKDGLIGANNTRVSNIKIDVHLILIDAISKEGEGAGALKEVKIPELKSFHNYYQNADWIFGVEIKGAENTLVNNTGHATIDDDIVETLKSLIDKLIGGN